jgi:hypothetical protein
MNRRVKGTLFRDYVRTIRAHKDVHWLELFHLEDLPYLADRVDPEAWYPMATFERMGLAILKLVANNDWRQVQAFGSASVDWILNKHGDLLVVGDPSATVDRFQRERQSFFDFPAITVTELGREQAVIALSYGMSPLAEEAACVQTLGFFLRLVEKAGGRGAQAEFSSKAWGGDACTSLRLNWNMG